MHINGETVIITDPCYIIKDEHWGSEISYEDGDGAEKYFSDFIWEDTLYGDWGCTTYNTTTNEVLGKFCADAGLVGVFKLDEVLKYNPDFEKYLSKDWVVTIIKDFFGEVEYKIVCDHYPEENDEGEIEQVEYNEARIIGNGNFNFYTTQTSL